MAESDGNPADSAPRFADVEVFKLGMRRLIASVCVITAGAPGRRVGLTATAVCSLSTAPPMLLCCVNRTSASYATILEHRAFAVNVLAMEDANVAERFSTKTPSEQKFDDARWSQGGSPLLLTAFASFDCKIERHVETGTHGIMFGAVEAVQLSDAETMPLLYGDGGYGAFALLEGLARA